MTLHGPLSAIRRSAAPDPHLPFNSRYLRRPFLGHYGHTFTCMLVEKNRANLVSTDIHVSNVTVVDDEANGLVNAGAHTERID
ncbi:hypothetical protein [Paraburkholderia xenovorans]|uniref:hypothetical protein n=1 Tax=Paraburkholderia xenovorans TaxID=36873 RepID=UPI0038BC0106